MAAMLPTQLAHVKGLKAHSRPTDNTWKAMQAIACEKPVCQLALSLQSASPDSSGLRQGTSSHPAPLSWGCKEEPDMPFLAAFPALPPSGSPALASAPPSPARVTLELGLGLVPNKLPCPPRCWVGVWPWPCMPCQWARANSRLLSSWLLKRASCLKLREGGCRVRAESEGREGVQDGCKQWVQGLGARRTESGCEGGAWLMEGGWRGTVQSKQNQN